MAERGEGGVTTEEADSEKEPSFAGNVAALEESQDETNKQRAGYIDKDRTPWVMRTHTALDEAIQQIAGGGA